MNKSEWVALTRKVNAMWPDKGWLAPTIAVGYDLLKDLPGAQVQAAVETLLREGREFPPSPSLVYKRALDLGDNLQDWGLVWAEILGAVETVGHLGVLEGDRVVEWEALPLVREHVWSHPLVGELVRLIGWLELCRVPLGDLRTYEAQARHKYEALAQRQREDRAWQGIPSAGLPRLEAAAARKELGPGE